MAENIFLSKRDDNESSWISVSDLMAGLMMVFMLIAIMLIQNISEDVRIFGARESEILEALKTEFDKDDLERYQAEIIDETLTIRFRSPKMLFDPGKKVLKERFKEILNDFFPRYITLLHNNFKNDIKELRIEGHTDSDWEQVCKKDSVCEKPGETETFLLNMGLSQGRTRTVLYYSLDLPEIKNSDYLTWIKKTMTANGLSSSRLIMNNGIEDKKRSRRVEFTIQTKAEETLEKISDLVDKKRKYSE